MASRGINLIGHVTANLGLGVAARNTAALLADTGTPFVAIDVPPGARLTHATSELDSHLWRRRSPAPYGVNLFHLNPPEVRTQVRFRPTWLTLEERLNVIVPFCEVSTLPPLWIEMMNRMDVVLAPTLFVRDLALKSLDGPRVVHFPQTVHLPSGIKPDRDRWGFASDQVVYISSFDLNSDMTRKNPEATVAAFQLMRRNAPASTTNRVKLVIKVNNPTGNRSQRKRLAVLEDLASGDPAIAIVAQSMSFSDVLSFYASADVFVSLHRAEGLGLGLLEAMMLGVPVIATAYSGNMDFMTPHESRLVEYTMVHVEGTSIGSYDPRQTGSGQMWAEPNVDVAARAMLELADDNCRLALGRAAQVAARSTLSNPARGATIELLLNLATAPQTHSALCELQRRPGSYWRLRGAAGRALRGVGLRR